MDSNAWKMIKIARSVGRDNPLLGYELETAARQHAAVINPGASNFDKDLESMVTVLKSLKQELQGAFQKLEEGKWDADSDEFAKFFDDEASAEEEELRQILTRMKTAGSRTAGPKDWLKKMFKRDKKKAEPKGDDEPAGMQPSYTMDESTMDEFVEGKRDWADPGHYIEQEMAENKEFFGEAKGVLDKMKELRKKPSTGAIQALMKVIDKLIRQGGSILKGVRKHLLEPGAKVEITEEGLGEKKQPAKKEKLSPEKLENVVEHYADMLKESLGDEKKTLRFLRELFEAVKPMVGEDRAAIAARTANKPVFRLQLKDKGQGGKDYAQIDWDKGWTWRRVDPSVNSTGYSRSFLTPEELARDIRAYSKMDAEAAKAAAYFDELAKADAGTAVAAIVHCAARYPKVRPVLLPVARFVAGR